jgi:hypothetical protein
VSSQHLPGYRNAALRALDRTGKKWKLESKEGFAITSDIEPLTWLWTNIDVSGNISLDVGQSGKEEGQ